MKFCLEVDRVHLANLKRDPRATMLVDEDRRPADGWSAPAKAVMLAGSVEITDEADVTEDVRRKLFERYMSDDPNRPLVPAIQQDPRKHYLLIVLTPDRIVSWDFTKQSRQPLLPPTRRD
jgi:hypothetical protein